MQRHRHEPEPQPETRLQTQAEPPEQGIEAPSAPHKVTRHRTKTTRDKTRYPAIQEWQKQNGGSEFQRLIAQGNWMSGGLMLLSLPIGWLLWIMVYAVQEKSYVMVQLAVSTTFFALAGAIQQGRLKRYRLPFAAPLPEGTDVRDIGPLIDRLLLLDRENREEIIRRLSHLLPRLQAADASLLAERHYEFLNVVLHNHARATQQRNRYSRAYLLAVLEAYARIGDVRALEDVACIARGSAVFYQQDAEVLAAAQKCLAYLQTLAEQQTQANTLLRGSEAPVVPAELLRPAAFAAPPDTDALLRPADTNGPSSA